METSSSVRRRDIIICLSCGYRWMEKATGKHSRQCPNCDSTDLITETELKAIVNDAEELIRNTPLGAFPTWDALRAVVEARTWQSKRYRLRSTLNLVALVLEELRERGVIGPKAKVKIVES